MKKPVPIFYLLLMLIFAFYAGKYYCWEQNPQKYKTSYGTVFKDWQIAAILAIMSAIALVGYQKMNH